MVTADALLTQRHIAQYLVAEKHAHYVFTVKGNQPTLLDEIRDLDFRENPSDYTDFNKEHGRIERRTIWVSDELKGYVNFPHAEQFFMLERHTECSNGKKRHEVVYGITSLTSEQASAERLLERNRGHWQIEDRVHYVRDVTFDEDRSRIRKGNGPQVMATIRNLVISIFRLLGFEYIADAVRYFAYRVQPVFAVLGI